MTKIQILYFLEAARRKNITHAANALYVSQQVVSRQIRNMEEEIENRKTTVWSPGHTMKNRDFWFASVTCGLLLMFSVGMMTQSSYVLASYETINFGLVMMLVMMLLFSGKHVKAVDDKYREAAGKPLDDALVGRK